MGLEKIEKGLGAMWQYVCHNKTKIGLTIFALSILATGTCLISQAGLFNNNVQYNEYLFSGIALNILAAGVLAKTHQVALKALFARKNEPVLVYRGTLADAPSQQAWRQSPQGILDSGSIQGGEQSPIIVSGSRNLDEEQEPTLQSPPTIVSQGRIFDKEEQPAPQSNVRDTAPQPAQQSPQSNEEESDSIPQEFVLDAATSIYQRVDSRLAKSFVQDQSSSGPEELLDGIPSQYFVNLNIPRVRHFESGRQNLSEGPTDL